MCIMLLKGGEVCLSRGEEEGKVGTLCLGRDTDPQP